MPKETKFTLALLVILVACFGVVVWQKMEHQKKLLAAMQTDPGIKPPGGHSASPNSPFDQFPGPGKFQPSPSGPQEPQRLPTGPGNPGANPFDQPGGAVAGGKPHSPFDSHKPTPPAHPAPGKSPFDQIGLQPPAKPNGPPQDLFSPPGGPAQVPQAPGSPGKPVDPFKNWNESQAAQNPPKTAANDNAGKATFDAFPATQTKVVPATGPGASPFDSPFAGAGPSAGDAGKPSGPPAGGGFPPANPMDKLPVPPGGGNASNPFDSASNGGVFPKQESEVKTAAGPPEPPGFDPFTPVQHTEVKPTPPAQAGSSPFDESPLPKPAVPTPPVSSPPKNEPPKGGFPSGNDNPKPNTPSPFESFPLPNNPVRPTPPPRDPAPPERPSPPPARPTETGSNGFPTNDKFDPPKTIDQQKPVRVYTVQADETYWSISKKLYGTVRYFQALAEHNWHRVGDPKRLRPGMKILAPEPEVLDSLYAKLIPGGPASSEPKPEEPEGLFFTANGTPMYRVGKQDTLGDIALKHLGRTSRWVEIYHLNQNTLPAPDRLKIGTVLKMPSDASRIVYDSQPRVIR